MIPLLSQPRLRRSKSGRSYRDLILSSSPLAYWSLADTQDASGNGRHLTAIDTTFGASGAVGAAATLNGTTSRLYASHATAFNLPSNLTLECWFRRGRTGSETLVGSANDNWLKLYIFGDIVYSGIHNISWGVSGPAITDSAWHHAVGTLGGGQHWLYVDGVAYGPVAEGFPPTNTSGIQIGAANQPPFVGDPFMGDVDEVAVYGSALDAATALAHYHKGIGA